MTQSSCFRAAGAALLITALAASAQVPNPGSEGKIQLPWSNDYGEALRRAETEKKPVLIVFATDWCGWSKKMERETFADSAVQKELRPFVLIRLNPEASEKNQRVFESFGVEGYPTVMIANFRGEEIGRGSYMAPKECVEFLRRFPPAFKGNPLGYKSVQLQDNDPLINAIRKVPPPVSRPASEGSFVVLDQSAITLLPNGAAKVISRTATFIADPEKAGLPDATRHYVSSREKLKLKTVRILDTRGAGREVDVKSAQDEHAYSNQNVYWDARTVSLDLPRLKEGQILDVIEERELQPIMPNSFFFRWNTGVKILLTSDLTITFPASLHLQKRAVRCPTAVTETRNSDGTITWRLLTSNPKECEFLYFSPPLHEIWQGYEFYTPATKEAVATWFTGLCQGRDTLPPGARQKVAQLKQANPSQPALVQAILDWVTKDIRYVSVAFGASSHQPHAVSETLSSLYGDCKDQSLLLAALCREAGIPASVVLVDALGGGFNEESPAVASFDHCLVETTVDGKPCYLDPASGPAKIGRLPQSYAGSRALKIDGARAAAVLLPAYQPLDDQEFSQTTVQLNADGSAILRESTQLRGQKALLMKERMKTAQPEKVRKYLEAAYKKNGRKLLEFYMTPTNAIGDTYESRLAYTLPRFGYQTSGGLTFRLTGQAREHDWIDALTQPRTQPFWFSASDASESTFTVELPAGAVLKTRIEDLDTQTPFMQASRKVTFGANKLSVTERSRLLEARLAPSEAGKVYDAFRRLHDHMQSSFTVEMPVQAPTSVAPEIQRPLAGSAPQPQGTAKGLRLSGISGAAPNRLAIINSKTLAAGESVSLKQDSRQLVVRCISISDTSTIVSVDGVGGTTRLDLSN
jgi:transglutaminase-like putative cysteine protease/thioredoxin-related protein